MVILLGMLLFQCSEYIADAVCGQYNNAIGDIAVWMGKFVVARYVSRWMSV